MTNQDSTSSLPLFQLLMQGLKALGKTSIDKDVINIIKDRVDKKKCKHILTDTRWVTGWIYDFIKKICSERD